ncbi:TIGR03960 family B12-binding radical SAM protein [Limisalsivibrio acetivorans]|uniref:TIGR03960 family B12-binding radical SAM protein n=1 Tax=Limisalsivibrio acetivorans TaxID=1304888 RepID=UPI0003B597F9|nr:TIGR03960 family B12-binding radical SAM protein [Limisalsivibrio acetivorans]
MTDNSLLKVTKPSRYINHEINSFHKGEGERLDFCLIFPDVYEVGMSHIGFKQLYERLNLSDKISAERFFMPWTDAVETLGSDIFTSLESSKPLKEFDVLGFSLQYELSYTNILQTLRMSGIPLRAEDRGEDDPLVFMGGSCCANPMPLSRFADVFFIGEMEAEIAPLMEGLEQLIRKGGTRRERLEYLDTKEYTWVPSLQRDKRVKRNIHTGFSNDVTINRLIVPSMPIVQDRVAVEISRGCTRGCRFCQAGILYRPSRERSIESIAEEALSQIASSGYMEVSLLSLSAADYSRLEELLVTMAKLLEAKNTSLSLPSIRADRIRDFIFRELSRVRKSGFTIAPEAGSQRMRDAINKNLSEEEIINAVAKASYSGWNGAKLYFMIGLPGETDEDVAAIAELAGKVKRASAKGRFNVRVSISNFVPKPHTPYQWFPMNSAGEFRRKQRIVNDKLRSMRIKCSTHDTLPSILEGVFSRGDDRLCDILESVVEKGAMFDGWSEVFNAEIWHEAFEENNLTMEEFSGREFGSDEKLSWEHIDSGVTKDYLYTEYKRSFEGLITPDCREADCSACGVCDFEEIKNSYADEGLPSNPEKEERGEELNHYILRISKTGAGRFMSAIESTRLFVHAARIAGLPLGFTKGFNPQPKMRYLIPPPVGVDAFNDLMGIEAADFGGLDSMRDTLNDILPEGFVVKEILPLRANEKKHTFAGRFRLGGDLSATLNELMEQGKNYYIRKDKKGRDKQIILDEFLLARGDDWIVLSSGQKGSFNLLEFFSQNGLDKAELDVSRTNLYIIPREDC